jgi:hypothetical protein
MRQNISELLDIATGSILGSILLKQTLTMIFFLCTQMRII